VRRVRCVDRTENMICRFVRPLTKGEYAFDSHRTSERGLLVDHNRDSSNHAVVRNRHLGLAEGHTGPGHPQPARGRKSLRWRLDHEGATIEANLAPFSGVRTLKRFGNAIVHQPKILRSDLFPRRVWRVTVLSWF